MSDANPTVTAKKSYRDGHVAIGIKMRCRGWSNGTIGVDAATDLTIAQARALASSLVELANAADAKATAKAAAEERRRKWRDREIAAGRMVVFRGLR